MMVECGWYVLSKQKRLRLLFFDLELALPPSLLFHHHSKLLLLQIHEPFRGTSNCRLMVSAQNRADSEGFWRAP
jgi:hypothetical protein